MNTPSQKEFLKLTQKGNLIPVYKEIVGDLETPVSAYFRLASEGKYSFLLESVEGEEKIARYSFIAKDPELILETKNDIAKITRITKRKIEVETYSISDSPLGFIREIMNPYKFVNLPDLPRFCGGMVGYMSYDIVRFFEKIPQKTKDDLKLPDCLLVLAQNLIIFDHLNHKIKIVNCVPIPENSTDKQKTALYKKAHRRIDQTINELNTPLHIQKNYTKKKSQKPINLKSNFTLPQFKKAVNEAKKQIRAGEIIQVVLSQRFSVNIKGDPFDIYRTLRSLNPSPYMFYLNFDSIKIIGASPEPLVRCENGMVETRPIAGTRPRGKTEKEDKKYEEELLKDPKERAEHIMLVDLGRNDLGRVCKKGSVKLSEFMKIERYSHVMHIVSNVVGQLKQGKDNLDVLKAAFPAGTLSGAPKIRAMEIIEDLESMRRGPYGGCIGYFSFSGNLDTCITIRTIIAHKNKAYIQAGAGIVADSNPSKEYQETINKAKAQLKAIEYSQ